MVKLKGENYGRIAPKTIANYIKGGNLSLRRSTDLDAVQQLRRGKHAPRRPHPETIYPKIVLLDLRPLVDFNKSHIRNALSFPASNIQIDHKFGQLNLFKNKTDKLLVVYNDDERHGMKYAQTIFEKGFDNCYLLSGGSCIFETEYPDLMESSHKGAGIPPISASEGLTQRTGGGLFSAASHRSKAADGAAGKSV